MRVAKLDALNRCTPGGEFKDNTFQITLELTAQELCLLTSALNWQQEGMRDVIDARKQLAGKPETEEHWKAKIQQSKAVCEMLSQIGRMVF